MNKKPSSPLPFYIEEDHVSYGDAKLQHIKCADHTYMGYIYTDRESPEYRPDEVKADADYIVHASNEYPQLIEFLERIESTTTDKETAEQISDLLKLKNIWT